jgi:hypothetical protein
MNFVPVIGHVAEAIGPPLEDPHYNRTGRSGSSFD